MQVIFDSRDMYTLFIIPLFISFFFLLLGVSSITIGVLGGASQSGIAASVIVHLYGGPTIKSTRVHLGVVDLTPGKSSGHFTTFCLVGIPQGSVFLGFGLFADVNGVRVHEL